MTTCFKFSVHNFASSSSSSSLICQTTGPKPLPERFLDIVRSRASSFNWQYPLLSLRSSSSFLRLLPRLLVTSICPFIFPSITCYRRQFLRKMWPIQLALRLLISCRICDRSENFILVNVSNRYTIGSVQRSRNHGCNGNKTMSFVCVFCWDTCHFQHEIITVIPRLTKIIRSGITIVSWNLR